MTDPQQPDISAAADNLIRNEAPDRHLRALLIELEETAAELRAELDARRGVEQLLRNESASTRHKQPVAGDAVRGNEHGDERLSPAQLAELDRVPEYLATNRGSWTNLFKLLREFRTEMREGRNHET